MVNYNFDITLVCQTCGHRFDASYDHLTALLRGNKEVFCPQGDTQPDSYVKERIEEEESTRHNR